MQKLPLYLLAAGAMLAPLSAQNTPETARVWIGIMTPSKQAEESPIRVSQAEYHSRLVQGMCETTLTLTLHNPNARDMEGDFTLPLPADATVQGYALEVDGQLVDAVPVTKEKARVVVEEEARRQVDPGLIESVGGNMFRTRVYPIPAQGTRRVQVRFITANSGYRLPMNFAEKLDSFKLRIEVVSAEKPSVPNSNLSFNKVEQLFVAETELKDIALTEDIVVDVPAQKLGAPLVEKYEGKYYALIPHVNFATAPGTYVTLGQQGLGIVWDASASMAKADTAAAIEALRALEGKYSRYRLCILRDVAGPIQEFSSAKELAEALEQISYDGATGDLAAAMRSFQGEDSCLVLVTDGLMNYAEENEDKPAAVRCLALEVSSQQDTALLRRLGARLIEPKSLEKERFNPHYPLAVTKLTLDGQPWEAGLNSIAAISSVEITPSNRGYLLGLLPEGLHEISYSLGGKEYKVTVDTAAATEGTLVRSLYATALLNRLQEQRPTPERTKAMQALGQEYGIVTPGTSLLVLESLEQYQRHQVRPPASAPQMREQYDRYMAANAKQIEDEQALQLRQQIKSAQGLWLSESKWYLGKFDPQAKPLSARNDEDDDFGEPRIHSSRQSVGARLVNAVVDLFEGPQQEQMAPAAPCVTMAEAECDEDECEVGSSSAPEAAPKMELKSWSSNAPYMVALAQAADAEAEYYKQKAEYGSSPGFYLDCADFFAAKGGEANKQVAARILSNLMEMELEDRSLMRVLGYKLRFIGALPQAQFVLSRVLELFPEEPQSYRDLALVLAEMGDNQAALDLYAQVLKKPMHQRFLGLEQILLVEMNRLIARAAATGQPLNTEGIDKALITPIEADLRVVLNWDTDNSDMDLWVTDAAKEKCDYSHKRTATGGMISRDVTEGYGPEEYRIKTARPGKYKVLAHYYGTRSQKLLVPVTCYVELFTNYGRPNEKREVLIFRLESQNKTFTIAEVEPRPRNFEGDITATRDYQIKANDTLESIAEQELGDARHAAVILRLNPQLEEGLVKGSIIKLP